MINGKGLSNAFKSRLGTIRVRKCDNGLEDIVDDEVEDEHDFEFLR